MSACVSCLRCGWATSFPFRFRCAICDASMFGAAPIDPDDPRLFETLDGEPAFPQTVLPDGEGHFLMALEPGEPGPGEDARETSHVPDWAPAPVIEALAFRVDPVFSGAWVGFDPGAAGHVERALVLLGFLDPDHAREGWDDADALIMEAHWLGLDVDAFLGREVLA